MKALCQTSVVLAQHWCTTRYLHICKHLGAGPSYPLLGSMGGLLRLEASPCCLRLFFRVQHLRVNRRRKNARPELRNVVKTGPKTVAKRVRSPLEDFLSRHFVKMLQCRIRPCLPMFAAHQQGGKINVRVVQRSIFVKIRF